MMQSPEEKLSDMLSEIDSDLLSEAIAVDTPEKMARHKKTQKKVYPIWLRTTAVAACVAILLGSFLMLRNSAETDGDAPTLSGGNQFAPSKPFVPQNSEPTNNNGITSNPVPSQPGTDHKPVIPMPNNVTIQSADMLNYYGALYLLAQQSNATQTAASSDYRLERLSNTQPPATSVPWQEATEPPKVTEGPAPTEPVVPTKPAYPEATEGPAPTVPTAPATPDDPDDDIRYYDFDPETPIHVTKVYFFQIELPEDSFLAGKVGAGVVDVVISDAIWNEYMITFKNGDRFYSCLTIGYSPSMNMRFSTHKFIDGYRVVKNFKQENMGFYVSFGAWDQVNLFREGNNDEGTLYPLNGTYVTDVDAYYTIDELEAYFRNQANGEAF